MVTATLLVTVGALLAAGTPFPVEVGALAMVGLVLRWLVRRENLADAGTLARIDALEAEVAQLRSSESDQRRRKHELIVENAALRNAHTLLARAARACSCQALDPIISLLEETP